MRNTSSMSAEPAHVSQHTLTRVPHHLLVLLLSRSLCGAVSLLALLGCDAPEEASVEAYFSPVIEKTTIELKANQPREKLLEVQPARCYRIYGTASKDPVTVTVIDDTGAPVRTTTSKNGAFEIGTAHGFCTRVVRGAYHIRLSSRANATLTLLASQSQK